MANNSEFVSKFNEIMGKYGSIAEFSKVLYEANVIPGDPIVIGECMIPVNDLERCYKGSLHECLKSRFSEREFIDKLGVAKLTKQEMINLLTTGVSNSIQETLEFQQSMDGVSNPIQETLKNEQNTNENSILSRETLKFQQISEGNFNPIFSDGNRKIKVNNNGVNVVSYACAVFISKFIQTDAANTVQLNLMDMTASNVKVTKAYNDAIEKVVDVMEETAKKGRAVDSNKLLDILDEYANTSKFLYRNKLIEVAERLGKIYDIYKNGNFNDPIGVISSSMALIKSTENNIRRTINDIDFTLRSGSTSNTTYGKMDCIPKLNNENEMEYRHRIGELNKILESEGYLKTIRFKRDTWDDNGNRLVGQGKEVSKTVANSNNPWLFDSSIVVSGTNGSTTFKLTEYGKGIFTELYKQAEDIRNGSKKDEISLTKEEFDAKFVYELINK